ncbi:hypothetical protein ACVU7I_07985, partial [Patulibacter sp. S7RM1-6]
APRIAVGDEGDATAVWRNGAFGLVGASRTGLAAGWDEATTLATAADGLFSTVPELAPDRLGAVALPLVSLRAVATPSDVPVKVRDLDASPVVRTAWTSRWLPGTFNLRTFVNYLYGDEANGGGSFASDGAFKPEPLDRFGFHLSFSDAWRDGRTGETVIEHRGTLRLAMPGHFIDIRIVDPVVRVAADGRTARLFADGQGSGEMDPTATEPKVEPFTGAHLLDLDLSAAGPRPHGDSGARTWVAAPAVVAAGAAGRYLAYPAGTKYGWFTFAAPGNLEVRGTPDPEPEPEPGDSGGGTGGTGGTGGATTPADPPPPTVVPPAQEPGKATAAKLTGKVKGGTKARRRLTVTLSKRVGKVAKRTYRVVLRKGRRTVATGTLRNRTLRLTVRNTARKGRKATYARIRGGYTLASPARYGGKKLPKARRIAAVKVTLR